MRPGPKPLPGDRSVKCPHCGAVRDYNPARAATQRAAGGYCRRCVNRLHVPPRKLKEPDFDTMRAAGLTRWHLEEG